MFGKLLKYDLKSIGKWYLVLLAITSVIAVVLGNQIGRLIQETSDAYSTGYMAGQDILLFTLLMVFGGLVITIGISSSVLVIRHFYQDIFSRRGYLTMTLPVSLHQILWSKLITALVIFTITYLVFIGIVLAFILPHVNWSELQTTIALVQAELEPEFNLRSFGLNIVITSIQSILTYYLAMAIGHLASNHKILMSFVSYFGLFIITVLLSYSTVGFSYTNTFVNIDTIISLIFSVVAYFVTHFIIKHKLNLE